MVFLFKNIYIENEKGKENGKGYIGIRKLN